MLKSKIAAACLSVSIIFVCSICAGSVDTNSENAYVRAEQLSQLGLLKGVGRGDYDMQRPPTRAESVVMVLRLLGKEEEALRYRASESPFNDVPGWAVKYVAYAKDSGLAKGISENEFGAGMPVNSEQYITFLLRALKYADGVDFTYGNSKDLASAIGLLDGWTSSRSFLRSDMILLSYNALNAGLNGYDGTLADYLIKTGVCTGAQWDAASELNSVAIDSGTGYEWKAVQSISPTSQDHVFGALKNAMEALPDEILVNVGAGKEGEYYSYFVANFDSLAWYASEFSIMYYEGSGVITLTPTYKKGFMSLAYLKNPTVPVSKEVKALAMKGFNTFTDEIQSSGSEYERVKSIHDFVAGYLAYDLEDRSGAGDLDSALNTGKATCEGYSVMFQFFAGLGGLESEMVTGVAVNSVGTKENHAWNIVKVDGGWYNIDVTWDDPVTNTGENLIKYDYFLVSDSLLSKNHTWNRKLFPEAPASWTGAAKPN
ncbi:MAG: hypothetical protein FWG53_04110 [Clostridiales bacterium]|nr:hypothetical protein [Clostridiales bacterium]